LLLGVNKYIGQLSLVIPVAIVTFFLQKTIVFNNSLFGRYFDSKSIESEDINKK
jgi:hypothetical protein